MIRPKHCTRVLGIRARAVFVERLQRAAGLVGLSPTELIRSATEARVAEILGREEIA